MMDVLNDEKEALPEEDRDLTSGSNAADNESHVVIQMSREEEKELQFGLSSVWMSCFRVLEGLLKDISMCGTCEDCDKCASWRKIDHWCNALSYLLRAQVWKSQYRTCVENLCCACALRSQCTNCVVGSALQILHQL